MNVSLTPELEKFVEKQVDSGLYQTASEVIRAGLRKLKEDKESRSNRQPPQTLDELEALLVERAESLDRGEGVDGREVFRRLRKKMAKARTAVRA
jgi:antitoxin ParD1/3/4